MAAAASAQTGVAGDSAGDHQAARADFFRRFHGSPQQFADDSVLERRQHIQRFAGVTASHSSIRGLRIALQELAARGHFGGEIARFRPAQDGGLKPLKLKSSVLPFIFASVNGTASRIAMGRQHIDHGPTGIAEAEQFGDFVESFTSGVVASLAEQSR